MDVSPDSVLGLKDSPNHIQEPLWIFPQPCTMTFPVIQIRSGKWNIYMGEPSFSIRDLPQRECFSYRVVGPGW